MKILLQCLVLVLLLEGCSAQLPPEGKINGVSFVANRSPVDSSHVAPVLDINANYAAVMPFGFVPALDKAQIVS